MLVLVELLVSQSRRAEEEEEDKDLPGFRCCVVCATNNPNFASSEFAVLLASRMRADEPFGTAILKELFLAKIICSPK